MYTKAIPEKKKLRGGPDDDGDDDDGDDGADDDLHLHVLPERLPLHPDRRGVELLAALLQVLRALLERAQLPVSLEHLCGNKKDMI